MLQPVRRTRQRKRMAPRIYCAMLIYIPLLLQQPPSSDHPLLVLAPDSLSTRPMFDLLAWLNYSAFDPRLVFHILLFLPLLLQNQGFTEDEDQTPPPSAVNPQWRMALYRTLHPSLLARHYSFRLILLLIPGRDQISSLEEAPTDSGSCISYFLRTEAINYPE